MSPFGFVEGWCEFAFLLNPGGALQDEVGRPDQNQLDGDGRGQGWGATVCNQVGLDITTPRRLQNTIQS